MHAEGVCVLYLKHALRSGARTLSRDELAHCGRGSDQLDGLWRVRPLSASAALCNVVGGWVGAMT